MRKFDRAANPWVTRAERFVRTARTECLDWLLISGPRQLDRVLAVFVEH